jgi:glycosyltransferase involved in cell wall biosynthesis
VYTYPFLIKAGYRFTFVISDHKANAPFRDDVATWDDVEIIEVPHHAPNRSKPTFRPTVRRLLKRNRFALIHSHGLQAAIPTIFANLGIGIPHVMTSQDVFHRVGLTGITDRVRLYVLGELLRRLDVLIAVSEDTREDHLSHLPALRKGPCRVEMIHNGILLERYTSPNGCPPANLRKRLAVSEDVCLMGFLGRFMEQKGFLVLIEALARLIQQTDVMPFHLVAVGSGDMLVNYRRELAENRPEVASCVSFLDHTPNPAPVLRELDLLVIPSLWEAHPLLPMEAMLVGLPIVGTSCLGLREVLRNTPNTIVTPGDAKGLADALRQAISHPWKDAAEAYLPTAIERFDVRHTAAKLQAVFDDLTESDR